MIMVIGEHVNKYLSLNKLGIIKSRTKTTGPVARRIQATGSNNEDAVRTQSATSAAQVDRERATPFMHTVGRVWCRQAFNYVAAKSVLVLLGLLYV